MKMLEQYIYWYMCLEGLNKIAKVEREGGGTKPPPHPLQSCTPNESPFMSEYT